MTEVFCRDALECAGRSLGLAGAVVLVLLLGVWVTMLPAAWRRWRTRGTR